MQISSDCGAALTFTMHQIHVSPFSKVFTLYAHFLKCCQWLSASCTFFATGFKYSYFSNTRITPQRNDNRKQLKTQEVNISCSITHTTSSTTTTTSTTRAARL